MNLNSVSISNFRNIDRMEFSLDGSHAAFIGDNGAGKTNLLEAVFFTLKGRPFRSFVQKDDLFSKFKTLHDILLSVDIHQEGYRSSQLRVQGDTKTQRFRFLRNEKRATAADLYFRFPVIVFSPQDHELVRGSPDIRRRFYDQVLCDICPGYFEILSTFEAALKQRNRLLKLVAENQTSPVELKSWNEVFASRAMEVHRLRQEVFPDFRHHFLKICSSLRDSFFSDVDLSTKTHVTTADNLLKQLSEDSARDLSTKWTHSGPHRDDLFTTLRGVDSRSTASQGQGRLLGLLLRWTHAQWIQSARQEKALFLLDDLSSELDQGHRRTLISQILGAGNQVLWTSTEPPETSLSPLLGKELKLFRISRGQLDFEKSIISNA